MDFFFLLMEAFVSSKKVRVFYTAGCTAAVCCSPTDSSRSFYAKRNRKFAESFALATLIAVSRAVILCQ